MNNQPIDNSQSLSASSRSILGNKILRPLMQEFTGKIGDALSSSNRGETLGKGEWWKNTVFDAFKMFCIKMSDSNDPEIVAINEELQDLAVFASTMQERGSLFTALRQKDEKIEGKEKTPLQELIVRYVRRIIKAALGEGQAIFNIEEIAAELYKQMHQVLQSPILAMEDNLSNFISLMQNMEPLKSILNIANAVKQEDKVVIEQNTLGGSFKSGAVDAIGKLARKENTPKGFFGWLINKIFGWIFRSKIKPVATEVEKRRPPLVVVEHKQPRADALLEVQRAVSQKELSVFSPERYSRLSHLEKMAVDMYKTLQEPLTQVMGAIFDVGAFLQWVITEGKLKKLEEKIAGLTERNSFLAMFSILFLATKSYWSGNLFSAVGFLRGWWSSQEHAGMSKDVLLGGIHGVLKSDLFPGLLREFGGLFLEYAKTDSEHLAVANTIGSFLQSPELSGAIKSVQSATTIKDMAANLGVEVTMSTWAFYKKNPALFPEKAKIVVGTVLGDLINIEAKREELRKIATILVNKEYVTKTTELSEAMYNIIFGKLSPYLTSTIQAQIKKELAAMLTAIIKQLSELSEEVSDINEYVILEALISQEKLQDLIQSTLVRFNVPQEWISRVVSAAVITIADVKLRLLEDEMAILAHRKKSKKEQMLDVLQEYVEHFDPRHINVLSKAISGKVDQALKGEKDFEITTKAQLAYASRMMVLIKERRDRQPKQEALGRTGFLMATRIQDLEQMQNYLEQMITDVRGAVDKLDLDIQLKLKKLNDTAMTNLGVDGDVIRNCFIKLETRLSKFLSDFGFSSEELTKFIAEFKKIFELNLPQIGETIFEWTMRILQSYSIDADAVKNQTLTWQQCIAFWAVTQLLSDAQPKDNYEQVALNKSLADYYLKKFGAILFREEQNKLKQLLRNDEKLVQTSTPAKPGFWGTAWGWTKKVVYAPIGLAKKTVDVGVSALTTVSDLLTSTVPDVEKMFADGKVLSFASEGVVLVQKLKKSAQYKERASKLEAEAQKLRQEIKKDERMLINIAVLTSLDEMHREILRRIEAVNVSSVEDKTGILGYLRNIKEQCELLQTNLRDLIGSSKEFDVGNIQIEMARLQLGLRKLEQVTPVVKKQQFTMWRQMEKEAVVGRTTDLSDKKHPIYFGRNTVYDISWCKELVARKLLPIMNDVMQVHTAIGTDRDALNKLPQFKGQQTLLEVLDAAQEESSSLTKGKVHVIVYKEDPQKDSYKLIIVDRRGIVDNIYYQDAIGKAITSRSSPEDKVQSKDILALFFRQNNPNAEFGEHFRDFHCQQLSQDNHCDSGVMLVRNAQDILMQLAGKGNDVNVLSTEAKDIFSVRDQAAANEKTLIALRLEHAETLQMANVSMNTADLWLSAQAAVSSKPDKQVRQVKPVQEAVVEKENKEIERIS